MERNDDFNAQNTGLGGATGAGSTGYGAGSTGGLGSDPGAYGATGSTTGSDFTNTSGTTGQDAQSKFQQVKGTASEKLGQVKEKVSGLNASLADKLDAGADKLRQRGQTSQLAGATGTGTTGVAADDRMAQVNDRLAAGMENTANWLRNGDLQESIEQQVRTNPGRTLLIALGVGYVLGKAFRK
jgi:hypothetical protein